MAKVLVVGGAGYIGSHAAKSLVKAGHTVTVIDNFSTGHRSLARYGALAEGDILDPAFLKERGATKNFSPKAELTPGPYPTKKDFRCKRGRLAG